MDMLSHRSFDPADHEMSRDESPAAQMAALIEHLGGFLRRQIVIFIAIPATALAVGIAYLAATPPEYTATATLLIDSSKLRIFQNQLQSSVDMPLDTIQVGSQVEILASERIARAVVRQLRLAEDPNFVSSGGTLGRIRNLVSWSDNGAVDQERRAVNELLGRRSIARVERTYALNISYTARNPELAARIANAIAETYIDDQLYAKFETTRRASTWLQDRINELRAKVTAADKAVLEYKERNKIVDFGGGHATTAAGGQNRLIGEQQLFDLNSQLSTARGATTEAKARLDRIEQIRKLDIGEAAVSDLLKNDVVTRLRNQYLDLSGRAANLSARYGADHSAAVNLREQMQELSRNITAELGRIAASYQSDYEIARTREQNLEAELANLVSEGQSTNRDRIGLAELESSAKTYHTIYESFLGRYAEVIQQESFPITEARVINSASPPLQKSKPITSLVLAISTAFGIILSFGVAALREAIDGTFRTQKQIQQALRTKCLAVVPSIGNRLGRGPAARRDGRWGRRRESGDEPPAATEDSTTPPWAIAEPLMRRSVDEPLSIFTEAFRAIKVTAELRPAVRDNKVIGVTSTLPNEGKSTIACNLAMLMADAGKRVILLDLDLRSPTLASVLVPRPTAGWFDVLDGRAALDRAIGCEPDTGLDLLPLLGTDHPMHSDEILSSPAFSGLIEDLRRRYDYIIVDLPPIAPVVDVRATLPLIDWLVFVVEWGKTPIRTVQHHLRARPELYDRLLGVVLNKVDLRALERFEQPGLYRGGYYASNWPQSAQQRSAA
ncbi:Wzz/FepE/Etk N-terminal domain-containing protein [Rhodopseudomonas palustris]|nr:Wzz/FepE/Etk N-terminal domain-containing protein [Rhodopseudomonas palustris]